MKEARASVQSATDYVYSACIGDRLLGTLANI